MASTAATLPRVPLFERIANHDPNSTAVVHSESGRSFTYGNLLHDVARGKQKLAEQAAGKSMEGERIAFLVENGYDYVVTFLSVLASNGIALPLSGSFPAGELRYILNQSQAAMFLYSREMLEKANEVTHDDLEARPTFATVEKIEKSALGDGKETLENQEEDKAGLMLYTSGTTSRPKGVILPSSALTAQATSLVEAWNYSSSDRLLHCLPLHHIHGTMNALIAPLFAGSSIEFLYPFTPEAVLTRFAAPFQPPGPTTSDNPNPAKPAPITFFTVVPTIYSRLLTYDTQCPDTSPLKTAYREAIKPQHLRLAISGSAALPSPTKKAWTDISTGNILLERYGMTEVGMALSCGLDYSDRIDGSVGWPLPGVQARLVDTETGTVIPPGEETDKDGRERTGEIQLRGPTVFREYFRNAEATAAEFVEPDAEDADRSKWFKTGDVAVRRHVPGSGTGKSGHWTNAQQHGPPYFIQGRKSADIIKTGGEKVSALEVERELLSLPQVAECAVVGVPSAKWGQKVAALVVLTEEGKHAGKEGGSWSPLDMRRAMKERVAVYKCPMEMKVVDSVPRNAMGKVNKKQLVNDMFADRMSPPPS
ncbi:MAG: hypothetical protein M1831_004646 [Alyxoria varia]|nr:MAG: hypothetical protein M1831_004646 [Alyxoria varia]